VERAEGGRKRQQVDAYLRLMAIVVRVSGAPSSLETLGDILIRLPLEGRSNSHHFWGYKLHSSATRND